MIDSSPEHSAWQEALQSLPQAVVALDPSWRPFFCNAACERLTGFLQQDLLGGNGEPAVGQLLPRPASLSMFMPTHCASFLLARKDGAPVPLQATYTLVCSPPGDPLFVIAVLAELHQESPPPEPQLLARENCLCLSSLLHSTGCELKIVLKEVERLAIVRALQNHQGSRRDAAASLGISRSRLYRRIRLLDIAT